jgi:hypothetical protein
MSEAVAIALQLETHELLREVRDAVTPAKPVTDLSRAAFDAMPLDRQAAFVRSGGRVFDAAPPAKPKLPDGQIRRSDFDKLGPAERHRLIRGGSAVVVD